MNGNKPIRKYRAGQTVLSVWSNEKKLDDGTAVESLSYSIEKSYKDKDGNWKQTSTFFKSELAQVSALIDKALSDEIKTE